MYLLVFCSFIYIFVYLFIIFQDRFCCVALAVLELAIDHTDLKLAKIDPLGVGVTFGFEQPNMGSGS